MTEQSKSECSLVNCDKIGQNSMVLRYCCQYKNVINDLRYHKHRKETVQEKALTSAALIFIITG